MQTLSTLGERLKLAREKSGFKQIQVKDRTNINNKTLSGYEHDVSEPDSQTLSVLADLYDVSYKWLLTGKGSMKSSSDTENELTEKDERDIAKDLQRIIDDLESGTSLAFDGEPMDDDTRELVLAQIERNLRTTKKHAKKKFTPKKYRDNK